MNQWRPLADGSGTFDTILANMEAVAPLIPINLRINVDRTNRETIPAILQQLAQMGLTGVVHPYLGRTYPYAGACMDVVGDCLAVYDYLKRREQEREIAKDFGNKCAEVKAAVS